MESTMTSDLQRATQTLRDSLLACEPFLRYSEARARLDADFEALGLLDRLSKAQARVRQRQTSGSLTQSDIDALRDLQKMAHEEPVVMEYAESQQEAADFLGEINKEMSGLLGINFASYAKHSTC
jgi:cell fate (sporulation/competence/biofilm development) regulator YlbF (YheA/YmcA/DUF963 family)